MKKRLIIEISVVCLVAIVAYKIGYSQSCSKQNDDFSFLKTVIETNDLENYNAIINDFTDKESLYEFANDSLYCDRKFAFAFLMASLNEYPKAYGDACLYINKNKHSILQKQIARIGAEHNDSYCLNKLAFIQKREGDTSYIKTYERYLFCSKKNIIENVGQMHRKKAVIEYVQDNLGIGFNYYYKYEIFGKCFKSKDWSKKSFVNVGDTVDIYINPNKPEECISSDMLIYLKKNETGEL